MNVEQKLIQKGCHEGERDAVVKMIIQTADNLTQFHHFHGQGRLCQTLQEA